MLSIAVSPSHVLYSTLALAISASVALTLYNLFLHPLRKFPGPKTYAATPFPRLLLYVNGKEARTIGQLHQSYGHIVRIAPDELSFTDAQAWRDIYGYGKDRSQLPKDAKFYPPPANPGVQAMLTSGDEKHAEMRKVFNPAFSERALKAHEPLLQKYASMLVEVLAAAEDRGEVVDMVKLYNCTTFDIMADLTFGEPLGCLRESQYTAWVRQAFSFMRIFAYMRAVNHFSLLGRLLLRLIPASVRKAAETHAAEAARAVDRRLESKSSDRPDIWGHVMQQPNAFSRKTMYTESLILMIAGTETTATLLSGLTHHLSSSPLHLERLVIELQKAFPTRESITLEALAHLPWLNACLTEALRIYPPVPTGMRRRTPAAGATICGHWIPPNTGVSVVQFAAYHHPDNFVCPEQFAPERWLREDKVSKERFDQDKREVLQPFSLGPRDCIGQGLAWHEIRLLSAVVLWSFDLQLEGAREGWADQGTHVVWDTKPLMCRLSSVKPR